jgi:hypothetical protein
MRSQHAGPRRAARAGPGRIRWGGRVGGGDDLHERRHAGLVRGPAHHELLAGRGPQRNHHDPRPPPRDEKPGAGKVVSHRSWRLAR